ncbi:protein spotted leaf 11-like [Pyrus x bretschneideri]|uniref:protein spotted leaf 11-like n=1 Tax=Pyrus x bretschneideri TaxID=225117 RepID=UPI00202E9B95|nr:protein spotted leaf 11-like [Pyrus x bretschneideri]
MEMENPSNFSYMGRNCSDLSIGDNSSAFSEYNSDRSGEFPTTSSQSRQLLIACASDNSDDMIQQHVAVLEAGSTEEQKQAAMEIRLLAKNKSENRLKIARNGAIKPLLSLLSSSDQQLQEYGITAILNLSLSTTTTLMFETLPSIRTPAASMQSSATPSPDRIKWDYKGQIYDMFQSRMLWTWWALCTVRREKC